MYTIKRTDYGYRLEFGGFIGLEEMSQWLEDVRRAMDEAPEQFLVFVDMRTLRPLLPDAQELMKAGQMFAQQRGMLRSVVILDSAPLTMQFKRIAKETGIYAWERYVDASRTPDWEQVAVGWLERGQDPDLAAA